MKQTMADKITAAKATVTRIRGTCDILDHAEWASENARTMAHEALQKAEKSLKNLELKPPRRC